MFVNEHIATATSGLPAGQQAHNPSAELTAAYVLYTIMCWLLCWLEGGGSGGTHLAGVPSGAGDGCVGSVHNEGSHPAGVPSGAGGGSPWGEGGIPVRIQRGSHPALDDSLWEMGAGSHPAGVPSGAG